MEKHRTNFFQTPSQVASSPNEVTGRYDSPLQQVTTSSQSYLDKEIMYHPHCPMSTNCTCRRIVFLQLYWYLFKSSKSDC